jgi:predicted PurR-regulated permease PerM
MPWILVGIGFLALIYVLRSVLAPFLFAALLAYFGDPVVMKLQRRRVSRPLAVTIVFVTIFGVGTLLALLMIPPLERQVVLLVQSVPAALDWLQTVALPWLARRLPMGTLPDVETVKEAVKTHLAEGSAALPSVFSAVTASGKTLVAAAGNVILVPVVTFYLLRDWKGLLRHISDLIPRHLLPTVTKLAREADTVLSEFVRGQLLVMLALGIYYSITLWVIGVDLALLLGVFIGLIAFVPYLGFILGVLFTSIAVVVQTHDLHALIPVAAVFTVGQLIESYLLTPYLVGDRIGLHPVVVLFAVLAGGQLFGFTGVLLALPAAAVIAVLFWHVRGRWMDSEIYRSD